MTIGPLVVLCLLGITFHLGARRHLPAPSSSLRAEYPTPVDEEPLSPGPPPSRRRQYSLSEAVSGFSRRFTTVGPAIAASSSMSPPPPYSRGNTQASADGCTCREAATTQAFVPGGALAAGQSMSNSLSTTGALNTRPPPLRRSDGQRRVGNQQNLSQRSFRNIIQTPAPSGHLDAEQVCRLSGVKGKQGYDGCYILYSKW